MTEKELLHIIGRFSKEKGYAAYVVGGYLRNEYLGIKSKDVLMRLLEKLIGQEEYINARI